ncbi:hypothetical protein L6452_22820 [Arctium lappa]|uniref:Uncharacterized protein n=1 Tax=Arctium lappa TaxID=4217 RepID=A0ACB9B089_ARCLA|nr:hypothetical protein L6452_22820 [Arctium lappa]
MEINQYMVPYNSNQLAEGDYADKLHPGYKFLPSDSDLIVHYLKPKIETGTHPPCRLHEVNLYDHHPQQLAETYRGSENKWYFLTSRERKYPRGSRPNRSTKEFGTWKATQKSTIVYDDNRRQMVGYKTNLAFYDDKGHKTPWLMQEYTTDDPNLPFGSGQNGNELNKYVLCKVYKKGTIRNRDDDQAAEEIRNVRNRREVQMEAPVNHGSSILDPIMQPVVTLHGSNAIQLPPLQDPYQVLRSREVDQSSFGAVPPPPPDAAGYVNDYTTVVLSPSPVTSRDARQPQSQKYPFQDLENLLNVQSGSNQPSSVMTQDATDHIPQPHDYDETASSLDLSEYITLDDLDASEW